MPADVFTQTLKKNRLSVTQERLKLFAVLDDQDRPLTMNQLINACSPTLDRSTVYRTVDIFEKIGVAIRVYSGWKYRIELSEVFSSHHHHITCIRCGKIIPFEESVGFERELQYIQQKYAFNITSHTLELKGLCKTCC